jgi:helicase
VDFPASQVIFDSLAMGIEWLSVQEFSQMLGRAGRPDYHDRGTVYLLVEPEGTYHGSQERTEDEVAFTLLKGDMEPVQTRYDEAAAVEETLANVTVGGDHALALNEAMVGDIPTKHALGKLLEYEFIDDVEPTPLGRAVTSHFLSPGDAFALLDGIRNGEDGYELVARMQAREREH